MKPIQAMKAAPCITGALFFGFGIAGPASAQGYSLYGYVAEALDWTENADLDAVSAGATATATTSLGLSLLSETPVSSFGLDVATDIYLARLPDGSTDWYVGYPSLAVFYDDETSTRLVSVGANFSIQPASDITTFELVDLDDDGVIDPGEVTTFTSDATEIVYGFNALYSTQLTGRDTIRVLGRATWVDFDGQDANLIPSQRQTLRLAWSRQLGDDLAGGLALSGRWFQNEDTVPTISNTTALSADVAYDVTAALSLAADLGIAQTNIDDASGFSTSTNLTGGASLDYVLNETFVGFDFEFGVNPTDEGALQQTVSLGAEYAQAINDVSSFSVALDWFAFRDVGTAAGTGEQRIIFLPSYYRQLTDTVSANLGYRYEYTTDNSGAASNGVFVGLTKNFQFLK